MGGNSYGKIFQITSFGESHNSRIGVVIDGCPAGLSINEQDIQEDLERRKPNQHVGGTPRNEQDKVNILSGVFEGKTTGAPIALWIENLNQRPQDYTDMKDIYRPSHGEYAWDKKFGWRDYRGGGRLSARETIARVAAGAVAGKFIDMYNIHIIGYVTQIYKAKCNPPIDVLQKSDIEQNELRCPDTIVSQEMLELINEAKKNGDTLGGVIRCEIRNLPAGLGEPVFDKLEAELSKAMMSINATKGFEIGSGFSSAMMKGSEHNDAFKSQDGNISTSTNYSGGVQGGISNGQTLYFSVAFKPISTILQEQETIDINGNPVTLKAKGRHDVCVLPRAVVIVEAMAKLVITDFLLRARTDKV